MHDLMIRLKSWRGDHEVPAGTEGSSLFVSPGDLLVDGEPVTWYQALSEGAPVLELEAEHYQRLRHGDKLTAFVNDPTLSVCGFVALTIYWPTEETLERFDPSEYLEGSGPEALHLPIRSISVIGAPGP